MALPHGHCIHRGKHGSSHTFAASLSWDILRGPLTLPFSHPGCHTATHAHADPHTHKRKVSHAGTRTPAPPQRAPAPHAHRLAGARRLTIPQARSRPPSPAALRARRHPHTPDTPPRGTHTGPPLLTAAGRGPSAAPGRPRVRACGKPEDLPCGLFGSAPPPPPGQLRGPGPEQLVFVPTRRPGGRAGGGRVSRSRTAQPGSPLPAVPPARGSLHLLPGIPRARKPPLLPKLRCHALCARPLFSVPG